MDFKNLIQLQKHFTNELVCIQYIEKQRWNGTPLCPHCGSEHHYRTKTRFKSPDLKDYKDFWCKACNKKFTTLSGSVYDSSKVSLQVWLSAMYLISAHKKGISSVQLAKDLGVTQKTAWFILHRVREMVQDKAPEKLSGTIESDETYMSRKYRSDYKGLGEEEIDYKMANKTESKGAVLGLSQRGGKIKVLSFNSNKAENVIQAVKDNVETGSTLYTDESNIYKRDINKEYNHWTVNHHKRQWTDSIISTNHVENFWSVMKRGVYGIYHQISYKHLQRYCNEFSFRYNSRNDSDITRFENTVGKCDNSVLRYRTLIADKK